MPAQLLRRASLALVLACAFSAPVQADDIERLSQNLVELRSEVEALNAQLQTAQAEHELRLRNLIARKGEVENLIKRQELELARLNKALQKTREESRLATSDARVLVPAIEESLAELRSYIDGALPFKRAERLAALDEIRSKLDSGVLTPQKAANRLWGFYEDELRLAKESGLYRQPVAIAGDTQLADVARLGMVALYYRTDEQAYGMARRASSGWEFVSLAASEAGAVAELFDNFEKQVRTGYFAIPNPLAAGAQ